MPLSIAQWSTQQWGVFVAVLAAGALAWLLAPVAVRMRADVRVWRLHHPYPAPAGMHMTAMPPDDVEAHVAPGPGSLTSLREVGPGVIAAVEPLVDDDIRDEVGAVLDAALDAFRVAVEPAMRTARLWTLRGGETYAENALRTWHILEITGEIPRIVDVAGA